MSNDPILQPFRLKHLVLRNRIIITAHEPAYAEDGMPKAAYRAYHAERAQGGGGADDDGRFGQRQPRQPARLQQHPCLEGRGGGLDARTGRRMPRGTALR
jgi:hypothetical protein